MKATLTKRLVKVLPLVLVGMLLLSNATTVQAAPCFTDLGGCYYRAARVDGFWMRWAAGLDCELGFISCAREAIIGY